MVIRNFAKLVFLAYAVVFLASCGSMKQASVGYKDASIHFVQPWKPSANPRLEVLSKPSYTPQPAKSPEALATKYAALMGVAMSDIKNTRLYSFIDEWMGTPYVLGGATKVGIDCSALVSLLEQSVYNAFDIPRTTNMQINYIIRKEEQDLKEGDLVFFNFGSRPFSHVGVYLQNGYVLHASVSKGVTISRLHATSMYRYFACGGSIPGAYNNYITANSTGR